jgi:hypothetical protein
MIAPDLPPLGTRVHVTWASSSGGGSADGYVAGRWACADCYEIPDGPADLGAIEDAGLSCAHVRIVRIHTDTGRDVMAHPADARVLVVPITDPS